MLSYKKDSDFQNGFQSKHLDLLFSLLNLAHLSWKEISGVWTEDGCLKCFLLSLHIRQISKGLRCLEFDMSIVIFLCLNSEYGHKEYCLLFLRNSRGEYFVIRIGF